MERPILSETSRSLRRVRWAQALVYAALGLALLGTAFQSWRDVARVRAEVTAAQGRRLLFALGRDLKWERPVTREGLERALRSATDEGLRCVVALGRDGAPLADAGDCRRPTAMLQRQVGAARPGTVVRAATSLARFWADTGDPSGGRDVLAPVYGRFTEGFVTPDLTDARTLLAALGG